MELFPAIDLRDGKAVRLVQGDYNQMTVFSDRPEEVALGFKEQGAKNLHVVDLDGAKDAALANFDTIEKLIKTTGLFVEVGGGIRTLETVETYIKAGVGRVILGTAAVKDEKFLRSAVRIYGDKIAVGIDIKDGFVAIKGWTALSTFTPFEFCEKMQNIGIKTVICTDVSKDGAMQGTNVGLYKELSEKFDINIIASGGVSSLDDIKKLKALGIYGAIVGKAYYTKAISLEKAIEVAT